MPVTAPTAPLASGPGSALVVSGDRPSDIVVFEAEVVSYFVDAAELLGVPKSVAAIYGVVFSSPKPLTFSEIEERLAISKGSVSQGLRVLREVGAIKLSDGYSPNSDLSAIASAKAGLQTPISGRASKARDRYEPDMELRKLIKHFLEKRLQSQLDAGSGRMLRIEEAIPMMETKDAGILRDRTKYLSGWHRKARALLPLIRSALMLVPRK